MPTPAVKIFLQLYSLTSPKILGGLRPPIYIRGTRPPPTADETDTESEPEDRAEAETALAESNHSIRPETEREQEDRDEIESDHFIQAPLHDSGWTPG